MGEMMHVRGPSSASYQRTAKPFYTPAIPKRPSNAHAQVRASELGRGPSLGAGPNLDATTIIAALAGGVSVLVSKALPEPGPVIAKVLGFSAMGFAVYRAFFEGDDASADKAAPGSPVARPSTPIAEMGPYSQVSGAFLAPIPWQKVNPGTFRYAYPVRILMSNSSASNVDVIYQILAKEVPNYLWGWSAGDASPNMGQVAQSQITLKPGEKRPIDLTLETVTSWPAFADYITIELTLQKKRSAETPWETLSTVTFYYNRSA